MNEKIKLPNSGMASERRAYVAPALSELGSFAKLTRDAAKSNYNDMSGMEAMPPM
jgi:hypothetical protein